MPITALAREQLEWSPALRLTRVSARDHVPPILLAGADTGERETVLAELTEKLPEGTAFVEATAVWEVLVRAPDCSLVIVSGELVDGSADALVETLRQRHPHLPVVSLKSEALA
jgi:hypothetical protein